MGATGPERFARRLCPGPAAGLPSGVATAPDISVDLAGVRLTSPVILAAGTAGLLDEMADVVDLSARGGIGAVVTKSITLQPREGNAPWRILPAGPAGMLNAIGLANPGLDAFLEHHAPRAAAMPCKVFASVAGFSIEDYRAVAGNLDGWSHEHGGCFPIIELNVSCPNVKTGVEFGGSPQLIRELLDAVRPHVRHSKLFVKLGPLNPELALIAKAAVLAGADGLTLCNTVPAMAIDVDTRRPKLANVTGGLSGPAVHPIVVKHLHDVRRKVSAEHGTPLLGLGGVCNWTDAAEFILAGASAVQVGTILFADVGAPRRIASGLARWTARQGKPALRDLIGAVELG